jgi:DUF4097 and DUF4098 domain-containing protein YvlB
MLEQGKIGVAEAERLLQALESGQAPTEEKDFLGGMGDEFGKAMETVQASIDSAMKAMQQSSAGQAIEDIVEEVNEAIAEVTGTRDGTEVSFAGDQRLGVDGVEALSVESTNGKLNVADTSELQILVRYLKKIKAASEDEAKAFADQVEIVVGQEGGRVRVLPKHPKPPRHIKVNVDFDILCPAFLAVEAKGVNGAVEVAGIEGGVEATSVNGGVDLVGVSGCVQARSQNGAVRARINELRQEGAFSSSNGAVHVHISAGQAPIEAQTLNGAIELALPAGFVGQLKAQTLNGRVEAQVPVEAEIQKKNRLEGMIGAGGEDRVKLKTLNGSITVKAVKLGE